MAVGRRHRQAARAGRRTGTPGVLAQRVQLPAEGGWRVGHHDYCASQYDPATPTDFRTWSLTDDWYAANVDNVAGAPTGPGDLAHFVIDTSRNGQGPWTTTTAYPDKQDWCNPRGRGLGLRPSAATGDPLVDAYLWVKTPG